MEDQQKLGDEIKEVKKQAQVEKQKLQQDAEKEQQEEKQHQAAKVADHPVQKSVAHKPEATPSETFKVSAN